MAIVCFDPTVNLCMRDISLDGNGRVCEALVEQPPQVLPVLSKGKTYNVPFPWTYYQMQLRGNKAHMTRRGIKEHFAANRQYEAWALALPALYYHYRIVQVYFSRKQCRSVRHSARLAFAAMPNMDPRTGKPCYPSRTHVPQWVMASPSTALRYVSNPCAGMVEAFLDFHENQVNNDLFSVIRTNPLARQIVQRAYETYDDTLHLHWGIGSYNRRHDLASYLTAWSKLSVDDMLHLTYRRRQAQMAYTHRLGTSCFDKKGNTVNPHHVVKP